MVELSTVIWMIAIDVFVLILFLAYPRSLTQFIIYRQWAPPTTSSGNLPFRVSFSIIVVVTVLTLIAIQCYDDSMLKKEGRQLSGDIIEFVAVHRREEPIRGQDTWGEWMRKLDIARNNTEGEFMQKFPVRIGIICKKLGEHGLLNDEELKRICSYPSFSTSVFFSPEKFATVTASLPKPERWFTKAWGAMLLASALSSFVVLVLIQQILKWLKGQINYNLPSAP